MANKKKLLIPEEKYKSDFEPFTGFYDYHIKDKCVSMNLDMVKNFGVSLIPCKYTNIKTLDINSVPVNTIMFSSSKKKNNIKNLMWYIRCLHCHPENIREVQIGTTIYYQIQNLKTGKLKGVVEVNVWINFIKNITQKIIDNESN